MAVEQTSEPRAETLDANEKCSRNADSRLFARFGVGSDGENDDEQAEEAGREKQPPERTRGSDGGVGPTADRQRDRTERGGTTPRSHDNGGERDGNQPAGERLRRAAWLQHDISLVVS